MERKIFVALFIIIFFIVAVTYKYPSFNTVDEAVNHDYHNGKDLAKVYKFDDEAFAISKYNEDGIFTFSHYMKEKGKWTNKLEGTIPVGIYSDPNDLTTIKDWGYDYYWSSKTNRILLIIHGVVDKKEKCGNQHIEDALQNKFELTNCFKYRSYNVVRYATVFENPKIRDYYIIYKNDKKIIDLSKWKYSDQ